MSKLTPENVLERIVLQEPWNGGYGGFDYVSIEDFPKPRRPYTQRQLGYDPVRRALTIVSGSYEVYDDAGYDGATWDVAPRTRWLVIPLAALAASIRAQATGAITVPAEKIVEDGRLEFDHCPTDEQEKEIAAMEEPSGLPHFFGTIYRQFSYGLLRLEFASRDDGRVGITVGAFNQNSETKPARDPASFNQ